MFFLGPRPYPIGVTKLELEYGRQEWSAAIPNKGWWMLHYLLVNYPRTVGGGIQSSPDLSFRLFDADGRAFSTRPIFLPAVTSPSGAAGLNATQPIGIKYPGGSSVRVEITGQDPNGAGPDWVSLTLFGIRSWERLGG